MYTRKTLSTNSKDISNYIEGADVYNSSLIAILSGISEEDREEYLIQRYEYRPELIAKDFYGSEDYYGLFLLTSGATLRDLWKGNILHLIPKNLIDRALNLV